MPGRHLSTRYVPQTVTVAAGVTTAAPTSAIVQLGNVTLDEIQLQIPRGHVGLTGIAFEYAGVRLVPWGGAQDWVRGDNLTERFLVDFTMGGPLTVKTFNGDVFAHTFYVRFRVTDLVHQAAAFATQIVPVAAR